MLLHSGRRRNETSFFKGDRVLDKERGKNRVRKDAIFERYEKISEKIISGNIPVEISEGNNRRTGHLSCKKSENWGCSACRKEDAGDLVAAVQYNKTFTKSCRGKTRDNGFKLKETRFRLDLRKKFFTMRMMRHWNKLPREAMDSASLELFKARVDGAVSYLL